MALGNKHEDPTTFCFETKTAADCLNFARETNTSALAHLFGLGAEVAWHLPTLQRADGSPVTVHLVDTPAIAQLRDELDRVVEQMGKQVWTEETWQLAQGATIDKWFFRALRTYPHLDDNIDTADVVVPLIPLAMAVQLSSFEVKRDALPASLKLLLATVNATVGERLSVSTLDRVFNPVIRALQQRTRARKHAIWSCPYWACKHQPYYVQGRQHGRVLDQGPRDGPFEDGMLYVPSTPLERLARMVSHCPCVFQQRKDIPFFMIASGERNGWTDGQETRSRLIQVDWSRFPGSVVELVGGKAFVQRNQDQQQAPAQRYVSLIARAKYCIITAGDSLDVRRVFEAIVAGCVPVFMSQWKEQLPFAWRDDGAFWNKFSIRVKDYSTVKAMERALHAIIVEEEHRYHELHQNLRMAVAQLSWGFGDPKAEQPVFGQAAVNVVHEFHRLLPSRIAQEAEENQSPLLLDTSVLHLSSACALGVSHATLLFSFLFLCLITC